VSDASPSPNGQFATDGWRADALTGLGHDSLGQSPKSPPRTGGGFGGQESVFRREARHERAERWTAMDGGVELPATE